MTHNAQTHQSLSDQAIQEIGDLVFDRMFRELALHSIPRNSTGWASLEKTLTPNILWQMSGFLSGLLGIAARHKAKPEIVIECAACFCRGIHHRLLSQEAQPVEVG